METIELLADWLHPRPGMTIPLIALGVVVVAALLWGSYVDLREMIIPNYITEGGIVAGLVLSPVLFTDWKTHLVSGAVCAIIFIGMAFVKIRGQYGFGMGDAKLYTALGLAFGPAILLTVLLATLFGLAVGIAQMVATKSSKHYPHGPQIAAAQIIVLVATVAI